jgi:hypothetical protein
MLQWNQHAEPLPSRARQFAQLIRLLRLSRLNFKNPLELKLLEMVR